MNDNTKPIIFGVLIGLLAMLLAWVFLLYVFGCGGKACDGIPQPELTPIPTLVAATLPAPKVGAAAAPLKPKCHITAFDLIGDWVSAGYKETDPFTFTDSTGQACTATFRDDVQQLFITPNIWYDGSPACTTCHYSDVAKATMNMDLSSYAGILAGSHRENGAPKGNDILGGGNWDNALLHNMLYAPDGKTLINRPAMPLGRPANVPAKGPVIAAGSPTSGQVSADAAGSTPVAQPTP